MSFEINSPAERENSIFWYIDRETLETSRPGDIVIIDQLIGEEFEKFAGKRGLGMAAIFLGNFAGEEDDAKRFAERFIGEQAVAAMSREEIEDIARLPYFEAYIDGIGNKIFSGLECSWYPIDDPVDNY